MSALMEMAHALRALDPVRKPITVTAGEMPVTFDDVEMVASYTLKPGRVDGRRVVDTVILTVKHSDSLLDAVAEEIAFRLWEAEGREKFERKFNPDDPWDQKKLDAGYDAVQP